VTHKTCIGTKLSVPMYMYIPSIKVPMYPGGVILAGQVMESGRDIY
jgi:hypothetical protein